MPRTVRREKMVLISVHLPKQLLNDLDELVKRGTFPSRSEAIRVGVRDLVYRELAKMGTPKREGELDKILLMGR